MNTSSGEVPVPGVGVVLVGCVKSKVDHPAPARDLYTSPLFRKERAYAEAAGVPWFILSAEYGLVAPDEIVEPYERYLPSMPVAYRKEWGTRVVDRLSQQLGSLDGVVVEVHAGSAYLKAIRDGLESAGATVIEPLAGLSMGERLAWYPSIKAAKGRSASEGYGSVVVDDLIARLMNRDDLLTPAELVARGKDGLETPGLYSWWVDESGAQDLSTGLGQPFDGGLIYVGLAGATRSKSGRPSKNTLWGRLNGMHLGSRSNFSTFRLTLGSVLAEKAGTAGIDEDQLSVWMHEYLAVIPVGVEDGDVLDGLETEVLRNLDPPLNLAKMPKSAVRSRLTELRRKHGAKPDNRSKSSAGTSARGKAKQRPVEVTFSPDDEVRIRMAAEALGVTIDEFVYRAAVEKANDLAGTAEVIARARGVSVNRVILDALRAEVDRGRQDEEFMSLLQTLVERDKEILVRLAE